MPKLVRNNTISLIALLVFLLSIIIATAYPTPSYADRFTESDRAESLTVKVGVGTTNLASGDPSASFHTLRIFTPEEMTALATTQETYSYFDSMPTVVFDTATGILLKDLLTEVGLDYQDVNRIYFYTTDITGGPYRGYSKAVLFDTDRYFYPLAAESWTEYEDKETGEITKKPGTIDELGKDPIEGAVLVEPMLAVSDNWCRVIDEGYPDFNSQDIDTRYRLLQGQSETEYLNGMQTAPASAKWVYEIDIQLTSAPVTGISLDQQTLTLKAGHTSQLSAQIAPVYAANQNLTWSTDNQAIATVDTNGLVTAISEGVAVITATSAENGYEDSCSVTVQASNKELIPQYLINPVSDPSYDITINGYGVAMLSVKSGVIGQKYFATDIEPVRSHEGNEAVIFVQLRDGIQENLNVIVTDYDSVFSAAAGFDVKAGDIIKIYIADQLTTEINSNPIIYNTSPKAESFSKTP